MIKVEVSESAEGESASAKSVMVARPGWAELLNEEICEIDGSQAWGRMAQ